MIEKIHHVGIAVHDLEESLKFYRDTLNLHVHAQEEVEDQGVKAALLTIGEGLHHICFETPDVDAELEGVKQRDVPIIDQKPRKGLAGMICFLHPKASRGVLVELATP